ncbi:hypothetical protein [Phenylobacterium sp.]|uniref:hypothetical protein n=1 Tax=Phenylobacterium sp. TaxID=1871053 RepID=UPI002F955BCF
MRRLHDTAPADWSSRLAARASLRGARAPEWATRDTRAGLWAGLVWIWTDEHREFGGRLLRLTVVAARIGVGAGLLALGLFLLSLSKI